MRTIGPDVDFYKGEYPWPATLFGLNHDDLTGRLQELNKVSFSISSFEVFYSDVLSTCNEAQNEQDFFSNLTTRSKHRHEDATKALKEIATRTTYNPQITTPVSAMLGNFVKSRSLDCLIKLLDALLPEEQQLRLDPIPAKASPTPNPPSSYTQRGRRKRKRNDADEEQFLTQRPSTRSRQTGDATKDGTMASQSPHENLNLRRSTRISNRQRSDQPLPVPEIPSNEAQHSYRRKKQRI